jgi:hypothetical protein
MIVGCWGGPGFHQVESGKGTKMFFMDFQVARLLEARKFLISLSGLIPAANSSQAGSLSVEERIQTSFNFWSELVGISYTTLNSDGTDTGVNHLTCQFADGANQLALSNTFVDLTTIALPGRQRSVGVAGDPSLGLAAPGLPWPHLWLGSGSIIASVKNDSNTANNFWATFSGYMIPDAKMQLFDQWLQGTLQVPSAGVNAMAGRGGY